MWGSKFSDTLRSRMNQLISTLARFYHQAVFFIFV